MKYVDCIDKKYQEMFEAFHKISRILVKHGFDICNYDDKKLKRFFDYHETLYIKYYDDKYFYIYFFGLLRERAKNGDVYFKDAFSTYSIIANHFLKNTERKKPIPLKLKNRSLKEI